MELPQQLQGVKHTFSHWASTRKRIKTEITLGNPSSGCQGVGICRVMSYGQEAGGKCPRAAAWLAVTEEGRLRISFLKSSMDKRLMRRHFGWLLFQVHETYELPEGMAQRLGLLEATVRPGIYSVWETPRHLVVDF
jgi:hypothetical protein